MGVVVGLTCPRCRADYAAEPLFDGCPACRRAGLGVNLWPRYDEDAVARALTRETLAGRPRDMWRYGELLPVDLRRRVSLGEGGTPLTELPRLAGRYGLARLYAKDETRNPTWSFKDRLAAVAVTRAVEAAGVRRAGLVHGQPGRGHRRPRGQGGPAGGGLHLRKGALDDEGLHGGIRGDGAPDRR